ncbi:MAG: alpha-L-fucosidase, partial [Anaerolineae bacterium]|nr:alpha-L-fucosidase [Anaerolineae bacterium]
GSFTDTQRQPFTGEDFRFTTNGKVLYATVLNWPGDEAVIKSLHTGSPHQTGSITEVSMLGAGQLEWVQNSEGLRIKTPAQKPCEDAFSFKIEFE